MKFFSSSMKCLAILTFCLLFCGTFFTAAPKSYSQNEKTGDVVIGEKLTYFISFANLQNVAFAEIQTTSKTRYNGREAVKIEARYDTTNFAAAVFAPYSFRAMTLFDEAANKPLLYQRSSTRSNDAQSVTQNTFSAEISDLLSAIYKMRRLPFTEKSSHQLRLHEGERIYDVTLDVTGKTVFNSTLGTFPAFIVKIRTNDADINSFAPEVLISSDEKSLPLRVTVKHPKGLISAELAGFSLETTAAKVLPTPTPTPTPRIAAAPTPRPTPVKPIYTPNAPLDAVFPFALQERLNYDVLLNNQKLGAVNLQIVERNLFFNQDAVLLRAAVTETTPQGQVFFRVGDSFTTYSNPERIVPYRSEIRLNGKLAKYNHTLQFDQQRGAVITEKAQNLETAVGTYDFLALAYAIRTFPVDVKDRNRLAVFDGSRTLFLTITSVKAENLKINDINVPAYQLTIATSLANPDQNRIRVWLSQSRERLPLRFSAQTPLGEFRADLKFAKAEETPALNVF